MITDVLLNLLLTPIAALMSFLPTAGSGLGMNTLATAITGSSWWPNLGWANNYVPIDLGVTLLTIALTTVAAMLLVRIGLWVFHQFWGND